MGIMAMTVNTLKSQAFKLKGRLYTFTVMQLLDEDYSSFARQLDDVVNKAPRLFDKTPLVLDCSAVNGDHLDLQTICQCLREHGILPVGIQGGTPLLETLAQCQGLAVLNASSSHDKPTLKKSKEAKVINQAKLVNIPVRSGQQVVSMGSDLIIAAAVSHGAELLSDGNIHVYGALRGRALAGISGNKEARIFCQSLDAELVSIAGFYLLSDAMEPVSKPCQIFLQDDHIQIEPL